MNLNELKKSQTNAAEDAIIKLVDDLAESYVLKFDRSRNAVADEIYAKIVEDLEDLKDKISIVA